MIKMQIDDKVKKNLLLRGFTRNDLINNRGLITATMDETILEVVKAIVK